MGRGNTHQEADLRKLVHFQYASLNFLSTKVEKNEMGCIIFIIS